jgi:hypothetical protein
LRNKVFPHKIFLEFFEVFAAKVFFLTIFKFFEQLKVLFFTKQFFFFQTDFLIIKSTFTPLKRNLKQILKKVNKKKFWQKFKNETFAKKFSF